MGRSGELLCVVLNHKLLVLLRRVQSSTVIHHNTVLALGYFVIIEVYNASNTYYIRHTVALINMMIQNILVSRGQEEWPHDKIKMPHNHLFYLLVVLTIITFLRWIKQRCEDQIKLRNWLNKPTPVLLWGIITCHCKLLNKVINSTTTQSHKQLSDTVHSVKWL